MVGRKILDLAIGVRIPAPEPISTGIGVGVGMASSHPTKKALLEAGQEALEILKDLNMDGDCYGRCVLCRRSPCDEFCRIRQALLKAGLI